MENVQFWQTAKVVYFKRYPLPNDLFQFEVFYQF